MKLVTNTPKLDEALKPFGLVNSISIETGGLIFFSGFMGINLETGEILADSLPIEDHANVTLDGFEYMLGELGLTLDNVVKVNCFLKDPADFSGWNEVYKTRFNAPYPVRTTVGAPLVAGRIEVEIVASRSSRTTAPMTA